MDDIQIVADLIAFFRAVDRREGVLSQKGSADDLLRRAWHLRIKGSFAAAKREVQLIEDIIR